ncbi:MAG: hypothetical protein QOI74_3090 [Micromonosporaceae bacterium]|jgi:hypothetical protein|nr:hypothetical protein [Micromonosporaceae bacterium]
MPAPGTHLGVDFGTSNTVAVLRWPDGRVRPLLFDGSPLLPSAVYAEPAGGLVVGRDAVHSARLDPGRFEPNPKRRIDDTVLLLGDREVPLVEVVTAVLCRVDEELRRTAGPGPVQSTFTCPASWGATRRLVLADAARAAGFSEIRLVPEPVAAATYFTRVLGRDVPIGSVVVVYDFGAGTIDASVVARTSGGFEVLAVDGRDDIGGLDIDAAVVDLIGTVCAERDAAAWERLMNPATAEDRRCRRLLWDDARTAKERLSRSPSADVSVPLVEMEVHVTRQEVEERVRPLLDQTVRITQGAMRWARLADGRVAGVFLVGGSSRIPLVATLLHRALGEAPVAIEQPELVVAEGSVLAASAAVPVGAGPAPGPAATPVSPARSAPTVVSSAPVSPAPVSPAPVSPRPVSLAAGPPAAARMASGAPTAPTREMPPYEPPAGPRARMYQQGVAAPQAAPRADVRTEPRPDLRAARMPVRYHEPAGYRRPVGSGTGVRVLLILLLVLLLIAVPVVTGYVAYKSTVGEALWPPSL